MPSIIKAKNITRKFNGFTAVNKVSFNVKEGEIFAFLGPNGAGKTTTIKMLTTLLSPTSGSAAVNGHDVLLERNDVRRSFGIVFQDPSLDEELTAWENLDYHGILYAVPKEVRQERIEQLLKIVDLWDRRKELVKRYSGGMKRRLEVARGLLHHPKIIFLDEPTLGLDPQTRNYIWKYIQKLNKELGITVFFTTHYLEEAQKFAKRVAIIDNGRIVAQGTARQLKEKTKTKSLEDAFIRLTGEEIREEKAGSIESLRARRRMWIGTGTR